MALIEEFEQFVGQLPRVPLTGKLIVEEDDLFGFLDQLRKVIPDEMRRALALLDERDRLLHEARQRGDEIIAEARRQADRLVDESAVLRRAEEEAERILTRARQAARQLQSEADAYADEVLSRVETFLQRALENVRDGRSQVRPAAEAPLLEAAAGDDGGPKAHPRRT